LITFSDTIDRLTDTMNTLVAKNRSEWRAWLSSNHDQVSEIWLVYYKKASGKTSIAYNESVEEALCYGWVDSIIKTIDEEKYARKFTPRKPDSQWSESNIKRVEAMIAAGLMTEHGMALVEAAKSSGSWDNPVTPPKFGDELPQEFLAALDENKKAKNFFESLSKTYQKQYIGWIVSAKRAETRQKRIRESITLLEQGQKLGLR
ncbi:MAG: YdeI/OmpD-associated family protein, partial [Chloroflexota bacterium]